MGVVIAGRKLSLTLESLDLTEISIHMDVINGPSYSRLWFASASELAKLSFDFCLVV